MDEALRRRRQERLKKQKFEAIKRRAIRTGEHSALHDYLEARKELR